MKIEKTHTLGFFDIDFCLRLRVQAAARFFQEMATFHSSKVGAGQDILFKKKAGWFLNRLEIEFFRYPVLGDEIRIITWSRGFKRHKAYRDYLIKSSAGEVARGTSVWIYFDFNRNRIAKVPADIYELYEFDNEKYFDREIDDWKTCGKIRPELSMDISLRYSDFDINSHVNNTIYLGFLETLYHNTIKNDSKQIKNIKIRFCREINRDKKNIQAGFCKAGDLYLCNIFDGSALYADAQIISMEI